MPRRVGSCLLRSRGDSSVPHPGRPFRRGFCLPFVFALAPGPVFCDPSQRAFFSAVDRRHCRRRGPPAVPSGGPPPGPPTTFSLRGTLIFGVVSPPDVLASDSRASLRLRPIGWSWFATNGRGSTDQFGCRIRGLDSKLPQPVQPLLLCIGEVDHGALPLTGDKGIDGRVVARGSVPGVAAITPRSRETLCPSSHFVADCAASLLNLQLNTCASFHHPLGGAGVSIHAVRQCRLRWTHSAIAAACSGALARPPSDSRVRSGGSVPR